MPLQSAHVFASHIGQSGKTTLCFNMSCFFAKRNADVSVLVMDLAEEGDLTKTLLGGVEAARETVDNVFCAVFRLIGDADTKTSGPAGWVFSKDIDITTHAIRVSEHNESVPSNVFLVSSGSWPRTEEPLPDDRRRAICTKIRWSLEKSSTTWKLFCDTDGDRRPSPFTMLGYGLCPQAIIPLHLSKAAHERIETMFALLDEMRREGTIDTQVLMIVWNMVNTIKDEPMVHNGFKLPFTARKVSLDILDVCNIRISTLARDPGFKGLFVHGGPEVSANDFLKNSVAVMRNFADDVLEVAELGLSFSSMKRTSGPDGVEYVANDITIDTVYDSVKVPSDKFEAMVLDSRSAHGQVAQAHRF